MTMMKRNSKEWKRAWSALSAQIGEDATVVEHDAIECWQYMGTTAGVHEFRHRAFRGQRTVVRVPSAVAA